MAKLAEVENREYIEFYEGFIDELKKKRRSYSGGETAILAEVYFTPVDIDLMNSSTECGVIKKYSSESDFGIFLIGDSVEIQFSGGSLSVPTTLFYERLYKLNKRSETCGLSKELSE